MRHDIPLDGAWEQPGRSPLAGGISGFLLVGGFYVLASSAAQMVMGVVMAARSAAGASGLQDVMRSIMSSFQAPLLILTMAAEVGIFFLLTVFLVRRWHSSRPFRYLAFGKPDAVIIVCAGAGALAAIPLAEALAVLFSALFPELIRFTAGQESLVAVKSPAGAVLVFAAVAVAPALCEETFFRGWLQGTLRRRLPAAPVIIIQAALFSLCHLSPMTIVPILFLGVYLGWLRERSGTIAASMTAHFLYNGATIVLANVLGVSSASSVDASSVPDAFILLGISLVVFAAAVILLELRARTIRQKEETGHARGQP